MILFSKLKQLRKRLRWKRRWLLLSVILLLTAVIMLVAQPQANKADINPALHTMATLDASLFDVSDQEVIQENSYIGVDENGVLSLFEGPPRQEKVIRSFFQINVEFLESSLPQEIVEQLYRGIQVSTLSEYNSVLSTFSDYAVELSEEVIWYE